jgi:hypothetical protein
MLGVDTARCDAFKQWSDGKLQMFNPQRTPEQDVLAKELDVTMALCGYKRVIDIDREAVGIFSHNGPAN